VSSSPITFNHELRQVLRLGGPMVLTQLFIMLTGTVDAAMAGHYASVDLAGVSLGGMVLWPIFMLLTGVTMALTPITAQLRGGQRLAETGHQIRQGLWICAFMSAILIAVLLNAHPIYAWAGVESEAGRIAADYLSAVAWGAPAVIFYVALRHVCEGLGHTIPPMIIAGAVLPLNALLNYAFIYGRFGFPELGGVGCGYATAIIFWVELLLILGVVRMRFFDATTFLDRFELPAWTSMASILRVGVPIGLTVFVEMAVFSVIGILIGRIGVAETAANSIAGNLNWATYVIPMALGSAASIRVGYHVGARDLDAARATAATVYKFSLGYAIAMSVLLVLCRYYLIAIFTVDPIVVDIAASLVLFIALYQLFDDSNAVTIGALRGYKDTRLPMWFGLVGYWAIAVPVGYLLAEEIIAPGLAPGVYGYWAGLTLGLFIVAACTGLRLWYISANRDKILKLAAT